MSSSTSIEWTDATWNPVRGCARVSTGCEHCYAERQAMRHSGAGGGYEGLVRMTTQGPKWTGTVRQVPKLLDAPLHWRTPRRVFVNSMSDLFHPDVEVVFIASVLGVAAACPRHTFQVLTKRPERMRTVVRSEEFLDAYESSVAMYTHSDVHWPPPNIWLGVSIENQATADERIPLLIEAPAAVRWISAEPLLGPVDVRAWLPWKTPAYKGNPSIAWIVAGGESGPGARPSHPSWFRSVRDQCHAAGVPFFFKQWGAWAIDFDTPYSPDQHLPEPDAACHVWPDRYVSWRSTRRGNGRLLDGREHSAYPELFQHDG